MSFRKRNVVVSSPRGPSGTPQRAETVPKTIPGVRPSPLDGKATTSTGTKTLDALFAGHGGLPLGSSVIVEETGTTDFGGSLLKYYAAEGLVQKHYVHVLGVGEHWGRELPGLQEPSKASLAKKEKAPESERMKIAWRYERLGQVDRERSSPGEDKGGGISTAQPLFCHDFDLSKRLELSSPQLLKCVPISHRISESPFTGFLQHLQTQLASSSESIIHRVVIPNLLSPAIYPHEASYPQNVLQFLHAVRALLRKYARQLTVLIGLPLSLYPRSSGLTRWIETLADGVLELAPFPPHVNLALAMGATALSTAKEEPPQGMLRIHRLPIFHEKGGGGGESSGYGDDLAFTLSRRKGLVIKPFSLPPLDEGTEEPGHEGHNHGPATKVDIEF